MSAAQELLQKRNSKEHRKKDGPLRSPGPGLCSKNILAAERSELAAPRLMRRKGRAGHNDARDAVRAMKVNRPE
jgi:hypothetical protein